MAQSHASTGGRVDISCGNTSPPVRISLQSMAHTARACGSAALKGAVLGAAVLAMLHPAPVQSGSASPQVRPDGEMGSPKESFARGPRVANFQGDQASAQTRALADWVARQGDHGDRPFAVVDKAAARLYIFDGNSQLQASSPVLLGSAIGDASVRGIGDRPIDQILPHERTTPAGRFVAERGRNVRGEDVVWVDYDAAVSMHRVITTNASERRLERLASPTPGDNRISYGCINVPAAFFDRYVRPAFAGPSSVIYVLPETAPVLQYFAPS